jgi:hypothetical protein
VEFDLAFGGLRIEMGAASSIAKAIVASSDGEAGLVSMTTSGCGRSVTERRVRTNGVVG